MIVIIKGVRPSFVIPLLSPFLEVSITLVISDVPFPLISKTPSPGVTKVLSQRPRPSFLFQLPSARLLAVSTHVRDGLGH